MIFQSWYGFMIGKGDVAELVWMYDREEGCL